jgi:cell division transport system permease protein
VRGSSFGYLVREGARNLYANRTMSAAAIGVLVSCLLLIGCAVLLSLNVDSILGYVEGQNEVVLFLNDDIDDELLSQLDAELRAMDTLTEVVFVSREEGLVEWMETLDNGDQLLAWLAGDNPLPHSYRVKIKVLEDMDVVLMDLRGLHGVDQVNAPVEVAEAILNLRSVLTVAGAAVIFILAAVSLVIVANTIRITVFNRRKEISIMKFVGATPYFIRLPFLVEGVLMGLISATIAFVFLWCGYGMVLAALAKSALGWLPVLQQNIIPFSAIAPRLYVGFVGAGVGIGTVGSMAFIGKYIRV